MKTDIIDNEFVTKYMINNGYSISFMESCTSGLLASLFTDTEGASSVFKGSFITYSNEAKISAGVDKSVISEYGVYSRECANAMANASKKAFSTDVAIGITGTTGNVDPKNIGSINGEAFYCILFMDKAFDYHLKIDVNGLSRKEIKEYYARCVYTSLKDILIGAE